MELGETKVTELTEMPGLAEARGSILWSADYVPKSRGARKNVAENVTKS